MLERDDKNSVSPPLASQSSCGLVSGPALFQRFCTLKLKNCKVKEVGALWVHQSLALDIFGSVSLHTDLQCSAISLLPVSRQDMPVL